MQVLETKRPPDWVSVNVDDLGGKVLSLPTRDQIEVAAVQRGADR